MDSVPTDLIFPDNPIVVTASRVGSVDDLASVTVIEAEQVERLGDPLVPSLLRQVPSVSVAESGPPGSLTEVRIRGAEANHTLLFIDGIRANDPAAGNIPRFELLNADILSRIEVVRGPQSALWGSEAIGGVISVKGAQRAGNGLAGLTEAGAAGFRRGTFDGSLENGNFSLAAGLAHQRSNGIDAFGGGDRDGYRNTAMRGLLRFEVSPAARIEASGFALAGRSQFDGIDPVSFVRADTLDESRNRLAAGRIALQWGKQGGRWSGFLSSSILGSRNRNLLAGDELNRTDGRRLTVEGQVNYRFMSGQLEHRIALAGTFEKERFTARDTAFGGFTDQDRSARHSAGTAEWRAVVRDRAVFDLAIRHDRFDRFRDSTNVRASILAKIFGPVSISAAYSSGIAQPTFFDLFGFFPGSFIGNPSLKPERSRGGEIGVHLRRSNWTASATVYRQMLADEIVDVFDPAAMLSTTENGAGKSHRTGFELEARWQPTGAINVTAHYAFLDADEPTTLGEQRESRRSRHSGSLEVDGVSGRLTYGAALIYTGARTDRDFDLFPAPSVSLPSYWLAGGRLGWRVSDRVELFGRISNAFDDDHRDVVGYRTQGRSAYAGIRVSGGR